MTAEAHFRSGFVALVGRPNVGKSTLVNALVGEKVAIVSGKPQTTRHRIAGAVNGPDYQLVVLDLPGFQKPRDALTRRMQAAVDATLAEVDLILLMLSAAEPIGAGDRFVAGAAAAAATPVIIAINKTDLVTGGDQLSLIERASRLTAYEEIFPISALKGWGVDDLKQALIRRLPPGPRYFPEGALTDQPESVLAAELIREQAIRLTREEVPHSLAVEVTGIGKRPGREIVDVEAVLVVERESQKGILIGKQGKMIKAIGSRARRSIEALLGSQVFLDLDVRVRPRWRQDERALGDLGL